MAGCIIALIIASAAYVVSIINVLKVKRMNQELADLLYSIEEKKKRTLEINVCSIPCNKCDKKDVCFGEHYSIDAFTCNKVAVYFMKELRKWEEKQSNVDESKED